MRANRSHDKAKIILVSYGVFVLCFLYAPVLVLILFSFNDSPLPTFPWQAFTLRWYRQIIGDPLILDSLLNSLYVGIPTMLVSTMIGTLCAFPLVRCTFRGKKFLSNMLILPMIIPAIMLGISLLILFVSVFQMKLSLFTVTLGHIVFTLPFVVLVVSSRLYGFDRTLEAAAMDLGANPLQTFRYVTFPLIFPGILAGALLAFTLSFDEFIITFMTTGSRGTLPMYIWGLVRYGISPKINALATLILLLSICCILLGQILSTRKGSLEQKK